MIDRLKNMNACPEALQWLAGKTPQKAWDTCSRADWMIWIAMRMAGSPGWSPWQDVVIVLCDCVEPSLVTGYGQGAIDAARGLVDGTVSKAEVRAAYAAAAYAAVAADAAATAANAANAYAAAAAAAAVYADAAADAAADIVGGTAYAAAYAYASAAANAAADAAADAAAAAGGLSLSEMADICRERLTLGTLCRL